VPVVVVVVLEVVVVPVLVPPSSPSQAKAVSERGRTQARAKLRAERDIEASWSRWLPVGRSASDSIEIENYFQLQKNKKVKVIRRPSAARRVAW
jgi:hypothetical protein